MSIEEQTLELIKKWLPANSYESIAEETGYSLSYVNAVMAPNNNRYNKDIVECARKKAVAEKERQEKEAEEIRNQLGK